jgi:8-amino-7-oxononanoate synthase
MADFTSSLYLGLRHPSRSLEPWSRLTTGKPAALAVPPGAAAIACELAALQGCEAGTLLPSTLHLFFDLFEMLRHEGVRIYVDAAAYPIARWAAQRVAAFGVPVRALPHFEPEAARRRVDADAASGLRPVIVADGYCASCGQFAPIAQYLRCVTPQRGYVVLDDTQALGIWGARPDRRHPYGRGGGGTLQLLGERSPNLLLGSSLAKGFGTPVAVLSGSATAVRRFERCSQVRIHMSPPALAVVAAARRALSVNAECGDALRRRLAVRVAFFRNQVKGLGMHAGPTLFPVQRIGLAHGNPLRLQRQLEAGGDATAVAGGCDGSDDKLVFVLGARHSFDVIRSAVTALGRRSARRSPMFHVHALHGPPPERQGGHGDAALRTSPS